MQKVLVGGDTPPGIVCSMIIACLVGFFHKISVKNPY